MTYNEFKEKWGNIPTDKMTDEQFTEFKNDCFDMYERGGFIGVFNSPYDDEGEHNGQTFKVLRRATTEECDLEAMPLWFVEFENGDTAYCYPEEICKIEHLKCPYCGSKNFEYLEDDGRHHCLDCDWLFDQEDIMRENLRHQISAILNGTSEDNPRLCEILELGEEDACGLSSLELPQIDKAFEVEGEGTIWFHIVGEDDYRNFDDFPTSDLKKIFDGLLLA